ANCAERLLLAVVVDRDAIVLAVAKERLYELGQVAGGHGDSLESVGLELAHDDVEHGPVADRHQGLGQDSGVGPQARALAPRQDHGALHGRASRPRWRRAIRVSIRGAAVVSATGEHLFVELAGAPRDRRPGKALLCEDATSPATAQALRGARGDTCGKRLG